MIGALALACIFGGLSALGWSPFGWWWLALLGYGVLFYLLSKRRSAWQSAATGFSFGVGLQLVGHGWVMGVLHGKVGMAIALAAFSTAVFIVYVTLFTATPCWLWRTICTTALIKSLHGRAALYASLLTLGEWGRSLFFDGFTSLSLGYSLIDTWFAGFAPILGLYGLTWLACYVSGVTALTLRHRTEWRKTAIVVGAIVAAGYGFTHHESVKPTGIPLSYRLLQTNVTQERKFDPLYERQQEQRLVEAIERQRADLIITPETAFTVFLNELSGDTLSRLQQFSERTGSHLFVGIMTTDATGEGHNSVIQIAPGKSEITQYDKIKLMPFGEYSPAGFGWFSRSISARFKDLVPGKADQPPFIVARQRIGALICHEEEMRRWHSDSNAFINVSNLAWFEGSLAIDQRLQMVRMRSLEYGRPILRATNTGITAHIDHHGAVVRQLPQSQEDALVGEVQPMEGTTPYARWGDRLVVLGSILTSLLICWLSGMQARDATRA